MGLAVNAVVNGSLRVELLDAAGNSIPGHDFSYSSASPIGPGDYIGALEQWKNENLSALSGQQVKLKFYLDDATVYSFHFVSSVVSVAVPEPDEFASVVVALLGFITFRQRERQADP